MVAYNNDNKEHIECCVVVTQLSTEAVTARHDLLLRKRRWESVAEAARRLETLRADRLSHRLNECCSSSGTRRMYQH